MGEWLQSEHDYGQLQTNTDNYGHRKKMLSPYLSVLVRKSLFQKGGK